MKSIVRAALLILTSMGTANAAWYTAQINRMQIASNGAFSVYLQANAPHECGSYRIDFIDTTQPGFKFIFAALLSYEAQKDSIQFAITSCSGTTGIFQIIEGSPGV